jgi:hypothetical protein
MATNIKQAPSSTTGVTWQQIFGHPDDSQMICMIAPATAAILPGFKMNPQEKTANFLGKPVQKASLQKNRKIPAR